MRPNRLWRALPVVLALAAALGTQPAKARAASATAEDVAFDRFVEDFRTTALAAGVQPATYDAAARVMHREPKIETLQASQPEFVKPIWSYLEAAVSAQRVADGRSKLAEQATALAAAEARTGVPREVLVAIWGIETDYGAALGSFNLLSALATLAYSGERTDFGRRELIAALLMVQQERLDPANLPASWAGAFGQVQMLPSTFLKSAVDGDGDGRRDLWHSPADALASAAAEIAADGWQRGQRWGTEVRLPAGFDYAEATGENPKPVADWSREGVRTADGSALPASADSGAIIVPAGARGPAFLVFQNFKVILKYNNAWSYALAVCTLADRVAGRPGIQAPWPRDEQPLSKDERLALQTGLQKLGFDPGKVDGVLGRGVRAAVRAYQKAHGLAADGFATLSLLAMVLSEAKTRGL